MHKKICVWAVCDSESNNQMSMNKVGESHVFSLYVDKKEFKNNQLCELTDTDLVHRITHVLRLEVGEELILFTGTYRALITLEQIHVLTPYISWFLPVLEREDFENALTMLTVYGAYTIIPFISQKSRRNWGSDKDFERAKKIMVAAAEQSKQYVLPLIEPVLSFEHMTKKMTEYTTVLFEFDGQSPRELLLGDNVQKKPKTIAGLVGPEGGFSAEEEALLRAHATHVCTLVPMTLKACDAVSLGMGLMRSLL